MNEELQGAEPAQIAQESSISAFNADLEHIKGILKENLGVGGMTEFDLQHIKVPAGGGLAFDINDINGPASEAKITGAILYARDRRAYWPKSGDDTPAGVPPDCHSQDGLTGVGNPGGNCLICPLAQFSSAKTGKAQACKATKQLFFFREGCKSILPDIVTLPPTSLRPFRTMAHRLGGEGISITGVVVEIGLAREKNPVNGKPYSVATFRVLRKLTAAEQAASAEFTKMYAPMLDTTPVIPLSPAKPAGGLLIDGPAEPEQASINDPAFD